MPVQTQIVAAHTALLLMDFQSGIVGRFVAEGDGLLERAGMAVEAARRAGLPVIYVVVAFRPGYPEVGARNGTFAAIRGSGRMLQGSPEVEVHPALAPQPGEAVVVKHRVGAFWATDLEVILRAQGIDTLVLAGIATSGVVLSTVRAAADRDYRLVVLGDCCADADPEVHRVLLGKVFPRQAEVVPVVEWVGGLG